MPLLSMRSFSHLECFKLFCSSSSALTFLMLRASQPLPSNTAGCLSRAAVRAVTWACRGCRGSAFLLLLLCWCSHRLALAHPEVLLCLSWQLSHGKGLPPGWESLSPFVFFWVLFCFVLVLVFPESNFNHWSLLHAISYGHGPDRETFMHLSPSQHFSRYMNWINFISQPIMV